MNAGKDAEPFAAAMRFLVCSDVHLRGAADPQRERLGRLLRGAWRRAAADPAHPTLDAVVFDGDLTDHGRPEQIDAFLETVRGVLRDEVPFFAVLAKNHDNWTEGRASVKDGMRDYCEKTGQAPDFHTALHGFHLIGVSTCEETGVYYAEAQRLWLNEEILRAKADAPGRPVFVFTHEHAPDTVYGSSKADGWAHPFFADVLGRHPEVVHFSGHSHYPLNDPRSFWRGAFTAVGTGAVSYAELRVDGVRKIHPPGYTEIAQYWLVEADASGRLQLTGIDALADKTLVTYDFSPADLPTAPTVAQTGAPAFPPDAVLSAVRTGDSLTVTFPPALIPDGTPVTLYRVFLLSDGETPRARLVIPPYWRAGADAPQACTFERAPDRAHVCVVAENALGLKSAPLQL